MNTEGKTLKNLGWDIIDVPGDGTCGYHAIMYSLEKNGNYQELVKEIKNIDPTIINSDISVGFKLRKYIENEIDRLLPIINNSTTSNKNKLIFFSKNYKLLNFLVEPNLAAIKKFLIDFKNKLQNKKEWIDHQILLYITRIITINIFIWDEGHKEWLIMPGILRNINNSENAIFIYYNGHNHYKSLLPNENYKLKEIFDIKLNKNNARYSTKYNFLDKKNANNNSKINLFGKKIANKNHKNSFTFENIYKINLLETLINKTNQDSKNKLKEIIKELFENRTLHDIFLLKHIINHILKKNKQSDILDFIIEEYKKLKNNRKLNGIKTEILLESYLSTDEKLKGKIVKFNNNQNKEDKDEDKEKEKEQEKEKEKEKENKNNISLQQIIDEEFNKTQDYYVLKKDDDKKYYIITPKGKICVNIDQLIIPCVESGAGGHIGDFINIVNIKKEVLNSSVIEKNKITEIFCGKRIDHKHPNEFLFYKYIYEHPDKYQDFIKFICAYKGVVKYTREEVNKGVTKYYENEFMIIENAKKSVRSAITIDFKIGSTTYRYGENQSEMKDKPDSILKILTQGSINKITMSHRIYSRIEGITGINNNIINSHLSSILEKRSDEFKTNLPEFLKLISNEKYRKIIGSFLSAKSLKIQICSSEISKKCKKTRKMRSHPLKIFDILYNHNDIDDNVLTDFEKKLFLIIQCIIIPNFENINDLNKCFSFIGSSLLFVIGDDPIIPDKKIGDVKLIDFGHPVNLFMEHIKLKNKKKSQIDLVKYSIIDYSIGIFNLYFIICYFLYTKIINKNRNNHNKFIQNSNLINDMNYIINIYQNICECKI